MTADKVRDRIAECCTLFGFEFGGKAGNVDPYYAPNEGCSYLLFFDGQEQMVYTLDAVMQTPFVDGKSLAEIAEQITITDW